MAAFIACAAVPFLQLPTRKAETFHLPVVSNPAAVAFYYPLFFNGLSENGGIDGGKLPDVVTLE
jgi:hypothetical protein